MPFMQASFTVKKAIAAIIRSAPRVLSERLAMTLR
jgi:hypothetical protein